MEIGERQTLHQIKCENRLKFLTHGDEGINHWYDLYSVQFGNAKCGFGCTNSANFVLYIHYHDGKEEIIFTCDKHSPSDYQRIYDDVMAG